MCIRDSHKVVQGGGEGGGFVHILDRHKGAAGFWQVNPCAHLRLEEGQRKGAVPAHDFAGRTHFRSEHRIDAGEAGEGQDLSLIHI